MMMLAEAGTGVGKTLGYLAPASLWAEANGPGVWIATFTRALQRQIEREARALFPDPVARASKVAVRKGRENYLCLLNLQEAVNAARLGGADLVGLALAARWVRASADGDMTGGDFPAWLPTLFAIGPAAQASAANLVDRRGECVHSGCAHYRACFIERQIRASRRADVVIANHAVVLTQAAFDRGRAARGRPGDAETAALRRIVFDEGHHLFDAADNAFAAALSGQEAAEMRRWIRGPEGRGRRGRGLELRLEEVLGAHEDARLSLDAAVRAASALPGEGWSGRIAPGVGEATPSGPIETFLAAVLEQLRARAAPSDSGMECAARPALDAVRESARAAAAAIAAIEGPLQALSRLLEDVLDEEADTLAQSERARIEGALRGLERRARNILPAWRSMLAAIDEDADDDPDFVDWFEASFLYGRVVDAACRRHWVDPTEPLHAAVIAPAHGVLVTSATLADAGHADPFAIAEMRTGAARLSDRPKTLRLASPFDYAADALALVVTDVGRDDPRQVASAMRELFLAAGGGALGLFTAIRRLKAVHERIAAPLADKGLALYAQHVDPLEVGTLVDIFRSEEDACLLGTDAVRDGVDVPGRSLRLLIFDRVPWPRPDILHKARRGRFGGKSYDDAQARARIAQAFGRLIRREGDRGVFVMLDAAAPTRLFSGLPGGVEDPARSRWSRRSKQRRPILCAEVGMAAARASHLRRVFRESARMRSVERSARARRRLAARPPGRQTGAPGLDEVRVHRAWRVLPGRLVPQRHCRPGLGSYGERRTGPQGGPARVPGRPGSRRRGDDPRRHRNPCASEGGLDGDERLRQGQPPGGDGDQLPHSGERSGAQHRSARDGHQGQPDRSHHPQRRP